MTTSEIVSIVSVALPTMGAVLSAIASFVGVLPGGERRLQRLVAIHKDMPDGEGRAALEDAMNRLAVDAARRAVPPGGKRRRARRKLDAGKLIGVIFVVLVGGGVAGGLFQLGALAQALPFLQWLLWIVAAAVTLFTTLLVTVGGMTDVFQDEDKGDGADNGGKAKAGPADEGGQATADSSDAGADSRDADKVEPA